MIKKIKNADTISRTWVGQEITSGTYFTIDPLDYVKWSNDSQLLIDIASGKAIVNDGSVDISDVNSAINFLKGNTLEIQKQTSMPPFADPTYRSKYDATTSVETILASSNKVIDYLITEERYVFGGEIIVENAQFGDYFTAEVYDKDNVIPEQYRSALCENHPCVAKYLVKQWMCLNGTLYNCREIDTRPLNAKITAGLYLRVTYYTSATVAIRSILLNYKLAKKL